jgi:hypothetical protein
MAKNLRAKIPETDTLIVCDTNPHATKKFAEEVGIVVSSTNTPGKGTGIHIAENPKEVAHKAVRHSPSSQSVATCSDEFCSIDDLSWGLLVWFSLF